MNKDQVKGGIKEAAGKIQAKTGELMGSKNQRIKGVTKEAAGKSQKSLGNAEETLKDAGRKA